MKVSIKDIGKIKKAELLVNGLTVIAGENNTGKSTVGKLIFSIVKALSKYDQDLNENKVKHITREIENLFFRLRRTFGHEEEEHINFDFRKEFYPKIFFTEIQHLIDKTQLRLFEDHEKDQIEEIIARKQNALKSLSLNERTISSAENSLLKIKNYLLVREDINEIIKRALSKALVSEFYLELSPKDKPLTLSEISINEGKEKLIDITIQNNTVKKIDLGEKISFEDATLIESPLILQMADVIQSATTLLELENEENKALRLEIINRPKVPLHQKDLISKLKEAEYYAEKSESYVYRNELIDLIGKVIEGGFSFEKQTNDFVYSKSGELSNKFKIRSINTASGLKSLGILQLLAIANRIDDRSLIIIDEPETHLHPKWQIEYAKLLVELVKHNCYLLVTTHSPYFIQAIKFFSESPDLKNKVNYYLAENTNEGSIFEDVNQDLNKIFRKLSDPLQEIVWKK